TVEAGDKGDTNGPKDVPVEYVGANDTVKGKDSVSVDVKPRQDSNAGAQTPARELNYPEDEIAIGAKDSGPQRTKKSGEPKISDSVTKENDDIFRFHKDLPPGFERVDDDETRVKFDGGTPNDKKDDVQLTIDPKTGQVTVVGGEDAKAKADIPVELINKDGEPKDSGVISINVTPEAQQTPPSATDDDDTEITGLGYPGNIFVAPDNYERRDSTGIPKLPESLKEEGGSFRFGPNLPDGFVKQEPSWPGVEEIVREGDSPSERIVLRINKSNGKVEVQAGDASDYPLSDLPIEYLGANGEVKKGDKVTVLVRPTLQSHRFDPKGKTIIVAQGGNPDAAEGVANKGELPEGTEFEFDGPVDTSTPGEKSAKVIVAYPDGSTESVDVTVNVAAADEDLLPDADRFDPKWESVNTPEDGSAVTVPNSGDDFPADGETDVDLVLKPSAGNKGSDAWDVAMGEDGSITVTPGADAKGGDSVTVDVELTYPDGSTETESFTVTVPDSREAFTRDNFGQPPLTAGDDDDISAEDIFSQADRFDPKWESVNTPEDGSAVTVPNSGDDFPADGETDVDLVLKPSAGNKGSDAWDVAMGEDGSITVTPGADAKGGDSVTVDVELTYPDGSTETESFTVTVPDSREAFTRDNFGQPPLTAGDDDDISAEDIFSQADRFDPKAKDGVTAKEGQTPEAGALIDNKGDLPAGTTFEWDTKPDVSVPGKTSGVVKVNYPDGSSETVEVELEVSEVPTLADEFDPKGKTIIVAQGGNPDAAEGVANKGELPEGTEFEFDGPVDTSTPGEKSAKVIVAYPDGSTESVDVTVNVAAADEDLLPDADRYEPEWNDTTIDDSSQVTVENKGDELPHGTEVELGWSHGGLNQGKEDWDVDLEENGDITITPGADAQPGDAIVVEVELNYPDGTSETKTFVVQVNGDREEFVPGNFGALPPLTGDDNDDLTAGDVFTEAPTVNPVNPGDKVITGTGKPGATITVTGPNGSSTTTKVNENGNWSIDVPGGATPESQYIVSQKDGDKAESDQVIVTVGKGGGEPVNPGLSSGSSNFDIPRHLQCAVFAGGVTAIPLILLSPLHNMYELVMNPHLAGLREQFNREIHAIDQQVRRSLGVEGHPALQVLDHINGRVHQFNQQLGQFAHENRHIGLAAAAIAVAGLSYQHCMNTQANQSSSATGSSVDLSSSSSEQQTESRGIVGWFQGLFNRK
ncbi:Rib/alpha-like domain-containing protein, partial [Corynebacterium pseudodiphtheriticum]|uniref:Rib/alpha-like domain-containing protein n=2 Tax=Corynebacterium pseudodiphtheriticum TaxID=37637 RepID=UPI00254EE964